MAKRTIKTDIGFTCKVDDSTLDDIRIFELVQEVENGDTMQKLNASLKLITVILGADQKEKLYEFLEKKNGKASVTEVTNVLADIFNKLGEAKKK